MVTRCTLKQSKFINTVFTKLLYNKFTSEYITSNIFSEYMKAHVFHLCSFYLFKDLLFSITIFLQNYDPFCKIIHTIYIQGFHSYKIILKINLKV